MTNDEAELVRLRISTLEERAKAAEDRANKAEGDVARLRALMSRFRTSLAEVCNNPGDDGKPRGTE